MRIKPFDRRLVLKGAGALSILAAAPALAGAAAGIAYLGALKDENGFAVAALSAQGEIVMRHPLPERAHGAALSPDKKTAVIFARRPGRFFGVWDLREGGAFVLHSCRLDRLFYGHGFFSADGRLLYATENDFENETGVLGVYDASRGFARMGEIATRGAGPHEAVLLRDGRTAAIANGGIITHPDYPRAKLNVANMEPNLTYLDLHSGTAAAVLKPPRALHQVSLRHMAQDGRGTVWVGGQYEGAPGDDVPLLFTSKPGEGLRPVDAPASVYRAMRQYVGSLAAHASAGTVATTSPRGGVWHIWDAARRSLISERQVPDVCGVAAGGDDFVAVDGRGHVYEGAKSLLRHERVAWDNHLLSVDSSSVENDTHS